jgi:membrane associated rhomboid family serine protease
MPVEKAPHSDYVEPSMLDDRTYMRTDDSRPVWPMAFVLMAVTTAAFVVQSLVESYTRLPVEKVFALSLPGLARGWAWQLLTFQFMHGGLWHLIGNLIGLYFFGRAMEEAVGRAGLLKLYFTAGFVGGALQMLFQFGMGFLMPSQWVVPVVSMRARTLLWISIALAVFGMVVPSDHLADAAHLGGIAAGCFYVRRIVQGGGWRFAWPSTRTPRRRPLELVKTAAARQPAWKRAANAPAEDLPPEEFISREVDPILEKISAHGIQSLTDRERRILEAARARMARR